MTQIRCWALTLLALALAVQTGNSEGQPQAKGEPTSVTPTCREAQAPRAQPIAANGSVYAIYSLEELGDDPDLGNWIADTIPEVIEPGSWNRHGTSGEKQVLRYYGPKKILVVYHTPAIQAKVERFLKNVKKALPTGTTKVAARKAPATDSRVVPAGYLAPGVIANSSPVRQPPVASPVPPPARQPRHLFHFIIRYEGAGMIDSNVVRFMKLQNEQKEPAAPEAEKPSASSALEKEDKDDGETLPVKEKDDKKDNDGKKDRVDEKKKP